MATVVKIVDKNGDYTDETHPVPTQLTGRNLMYCDEKLDVGTDAEPLAADQSCAEVLLVAPVDNAYTVFVGNATKQTVPLRPGQSLPLNINNVNKVYVRTVAGVASIAWIAYGS